MDEFLNYLNKLSDNPIVIIVVIAALVLVVGLIFLAKTSIGKKKYEDANNQSKEANEKSDKAIVDIEKYKDETTKSVNVLKEEAEKSAKQCSMDVATVINYFSEFRADIFKVIEEFPNAKVKKAISDIEEKYKDKLPEVNPQLLEEAKEIRENTALIERLNKVEQFIKEYNKVAENGCLTVKKEETDNGEERKDSNPEEEITKEVE